MEQFSRSFIKNIKLAKDKYKIEVPLHKVPKALRDLKIHFSSLHAFSDEKNNLDKNAENSRDFGAKMS